MKKLSFIMIAISVQPHNFQPLLNKGTTLSKLGRYEEAISYYDKVLAIKPDNVDALNNKGNALNSLNRYEEAISYFDKALALSCLKDAYQIGISTINAKLVDRVALNEGFDVARKIARKEIKLDGTKYNIALEIAVFTHTL
jgi:tetratricopeptide (TPR) repeat protein